MSRQKYLTSPNVRYEHKFCQNQFCLMFQPMAVTLSVHLRKFKSFIHTTIRKTSKHISSLRVLLVYGPMTNTNIIRVFKTFKIKSLHTHIRILHVKWACPGLEIRTVYAVTVYHPEAMSYPGNDNMFEGINLNWNFILIWGTVDLLQI